MNSIDNPNETAKKPTTSTPSAEEHNTALVAELTRCKRLIASLGHRFGADVRAEEETTEEESADVEPHTEPNPAPLSPPFALRCDGRLLLSTRDLEGVDLTGRETFTGIVLSEAEAADALERLAHAFVEAASHGAGWLLRQGKKDEKDEKDKKDEGDA